MIATSPMDPMTVQYCFPDQPGIDTVISQITPDASNYSAALECGRMFNEARFWLIACALGSPLFLERGKAALGNRF